MTLLEHVTFRQLGALRYAVREAGPADGTPIVLLHGLLDTGASFAALVDAIDARVPGHYRFIVPDWRGHGQTQSIDNTYWFPEYLVDLERLIDNVVGAADQRVILVGHSMGGQVASQYAGVRPHRVSHLVTLDSLNVPDADTAETARRYRRWLDAQASPPIERVYDDTAAIAQRIGKRYPELDDNELATLAERWSESVDDTERRRMNHDVWHRATAAYGFRADEAMALWREVSAAVLCIDAAGSMMRFVIDDEEMARRRACFTTVEHVVLERCGHMLHIQRPEALADAICAFLSAHE
ncbi:alpha/beta fold hydrolase [Salinisphaera aquimarina]|uniref:Alpha/beta fold hydrolase n=1 Tax=Salinisphaera aquimarina TaxID=2094031 RepID=A0ABV7EJ45_9GAMM